ncbi:P-loop containing nucleoside triphosphate hydrolase protein [Catenaria anguillulae PL171]|uniref:p-loop containing nucleoside triphosphate hydrolase protein n=1 Tax=Catenaria anguillulae PL171 TaxID=765915 RepID=A0A1Y2HUW9_9FUNG|nr:P-loop containing nucleoside triphosphate hydrolase protein [Catenaria anguillulae PL171]
MGRLVPKTEPEKFTFAVPDVAEREVDTIAPTPAGFQNELYQYQQRSLAWLLRIENEVGARTIEVMPKDAPNRNAEVEVNNYLNMDDVGKPRILRIGPGGVMYHLSRQEISDRDKWSPLLPVMKKMECRGAVEASKVGTGKTVVALALIMSRPFRSVAELPIPTWAPWEARQYLPSRATLVVARSDLTAQWRTEAMRFLPESARVVMLTTMVDHKKVSWNQLLLADLVIVSTAFLRNANYQKMVAALVGLPKYQYPLAQRRAALTATSADRDQRAFAFALGDFVESLRNKGRQVFGNTTGQCVMERVYWHRVIVDEAHEFCATTAGQSSAGEAHVSTLTKDQIKQAQQARGFIEALRTRFMLGLTGSPPIDTPEKVADFAQLLQVYDLPVTRPAADAFLSAMSRSARPDLQLPPITDEMVHLGGENVMSVDKLTDVLQTRRSGDMQALQERDTMLQQSLQAQLRTLAHMVKRHVPLRQAAREALGGDDGFLAQLDEYLGAQVVAAAEQWWAAMMDYADAAANAAAGTGGAAGGTKKKMSKQEIILLDQEVRAKATSIRAFHQQQIVPNQQRLEEITRQHNFMESVITLISSGEEVECNICFESTLGPGAVGMVLRCGHMYCEPCVIRLQNHHGGYGGQPLCPQCRHPIRDPIKMRWPIPQKQLEEMEKEKEREAENPGGLDYSKYGSKIKALVQYVNDTVRQDPKAKVLVFVQFRRLSDLISSAFSSLGVTNVRMAGGNVYVKRKALMAFKTDPTVKVLFLSYQDCVSGLHLTEANHVLIVHPFLARDEQTAKAYEMQGIARAVRAGQTRPVHVVRFVCEHTLEQDIHNQRSTPLTAAELEALANQEQQQQQAAAANGGGAL